MCVGRCGWVGGVFWHARCCALCDGKKGCGEVGRTSHV
jgi:hypothetical protein